MFSLLGGVVVLHARGGVAEFNHLSFDLAVDVVLHRPRVALGERERGCGIGEECVRGETDGGLITVGVFVDGLHLGDTLVRAGDGVGLGDGGRVEMRIVGT